MLHPAAKPFADCSQAELLEHAIARLAAVHGERGVIADYLRARLQALDHDVEAQRRAGSTTGLSRFRSKPH
jgi:hypothetical protein